MNLRDLAERVFWTFLVAAVGNTAFANLFDVDQLKAAGMAGTTAVGTAIVVYGRKRLKVLPDPGDGLPGLPVEGT